MTDELTRVKKLLSQSERKISHLIADEALDYYVKAVLRSIVLEIRAELHG
jgi:hypothetical protein